MAGLDDIQCLYQNYVAEIQRLERARRPGDGLLGMGRGPSDDPCHDRFAQDVEMCLREIAREHLPSGQIREILDYIYRAPVENRENQAAYWMLAAVHGFTLELIGQLNPPEAQELWASYSRHYPRWERLPVQKQVCSALNAAQRRK